jgi:thiamine pyrophosphokinase
MTASAILFANGRLPDLEAARLLVSPQDVLIAADGGTRHARTLGLLPSVVIGDLDSLSAADRSELETAGARLLQHPADKDETDLELALAYALENGFSPIRILAGLGGRLDQCLGNLALLTAPASLQADVRLDDGLEEAFFTRGRSEVRGRPGELVSLLPWGGAARGVTTSGLRWPLSNETLYPERTRGISNRLLSDQASVTLASGLVLIIHRRTLDA